MAAVVGASTFYVDYAALAAGSVSRPMVVLRKTVPIGVASGGGNLTWDIEDLDTHGWHSTSSNTSRITPLRAGWIRFTGTVHWVGNTTGRRGVGIRLNGGTIYYGEIKAATSASTVSASVTVTLSANGSTDYFEVFAFQDSGVSLNVTDSTGTRFEAEWLRDL